MIWSVPLTRIIADYEHTVIINVDDLVNMTEGMAMDWVLADYLEKLKDRFPEAGPVTKEHLAINATREYDYNRVKVVVRWNRAGVGAVYIPSEDRVIMPSWPVGLDVSRFRLPKAPEYKALSIWAGTDQIQRPEKPDHKELYLLGYDPEKNAWVYDERGRGAGSVPRRRTTIENRAGSIVEEAFESARSMITKVSEERFKTPAQLRSDFGLNGHMKHAHIPVRLETNNKLYEWSPGHTDKDKKLTKAKPLKDQPVRESGLGIW